MKKIMIQGTSSSAGKSLITSGLCRIFYEDGYKVSPFKSQNMTLNTYIDIDGKELGRAQAIQSECAGETPRYYMNPILLKPTSDKTSDIILNGKFFKELEANDYYNNIENFKNIISQNFEIIEKKYDICVIEGGGSPAEINFRDKDIVNMGLAEMVDTPVVLVANIEFGGVFASLLGTILLLEKSDRDRIKGIIINKFRGDKNLLQTGIEMFQKKLTEYGYNIKILGVIPYKKLNIEEEDSLNIKTSTKNGQTKIGILKYPRISDFNEFNILKKFDNLEIYYIENPEILENMDILILPSSNNVISDLEWLKNRELDKAILKFSKQNKQLVGIGEGTEILGKKLIRDNEVFLGLGLLDLDTNIEKLKEKKNIEENIKFLGQKTTINGYINNNKIFPENKLLFIKNNIIACRIPQFFKNSLFFKKIICSKNISEEFEREKNNEIEYQKLAKLLRDNLDIEEIYNILFKR